MSGKLVDLLVTMTRDGERLAAFLSAPEQELQSWRLSDEERSAILSRDSRLLKRALVASEVGLPQYVAGLPQYVAGLPQYVAGLPQYVVG
jgi:hypothetical protein